MSAEAGAPRSRTRASPLVRVTMPQWSAPAWGAIGVSALFIALTCWWLSQDRSIPIFDAGLHVTLAILVHRDLDAGHVGKALTLTYPYPPFAYLIGSLGMWIGGVGIAPLIIAEDIVFVPLLALGCYKVGRLAFGPTAGLLAVVFALGSPLISAQFRVFMVDAPETAMVAVSVWLVIATRGFTQVKVCALAGLAVGLAAVTKEPAATFVAGVVLVTLWRGGRGAWRGFAVFALVVLVIALPWYIAELKQLQALGSEAASSSSTFNQYLIPDVAPPRFSLENLSWYLWNFITAQLLLPLVIFAAVGWLWTLFGFARRKLVSPLALELTVGAFVGWAIVTETFIHDTRYSMPLLIYLAVFGAGWITRLPRPGRVVMGGALVLVALANTLGIVFAVGSNVQFSLPGAAVGTIQQAGTVKIFENQGFLVSQPRRDGDLLAMFQALHRNGVRYVDWSYLQATEPDFSSGGVAAFALIANLIESGNGTAPGDEYATLVHEPIGSEGPPPCVTLDDHTGVWVRLGNVKAPGAQDYCPLPTPHFYG